VPATGSCSFRRHRTRDNHVVHFVYIVRCADGSLYTGCARDPRAREKLHNSGRGARYTRGRRPVMLVYSERFRSLGAALRREYQLKQLSRKNKDTLILSPPPTRSPGGSRPRAR
jgi:predicted GIY-YIG superfamily endonuclease